MQQFQEKPEAMPSVSQAWVAKQFSGSPPNTFIVHKLHATLISADGNNSLCQHNWVKCEYSTYKVIH